MGVGKWVWVGGDMGVSDGVHHCSAYDNGRTSDNFLSIVTFDRSIVCLRERDVWHNAISGIGSVVAKKQQSLTYKYRGG